MKGKKISELSLDEKVLLTSGKDTWWIGNGLQFLFEMRDGPHGLRKDQSCCYPNMNLLASSWDKNAFSVIAKHIANDYKKANVDIVLGPGVNLIRTPLGGRNFEYLSEDVILTAELASSYINSLQENGVYACVKHFCCNNQENRRFSYSAEVSSRALHELYLRVFELIIKKANPQFLMTAYNKVNGIYTSESKYLLTDILRNKFQYKGIVFSDWGAIDNKVKSIDAGLDFDMPGVNYACLAEVKNAIENGNLSENKIDDILNRIIKVQKNNNEVEQLNDNEIIDICAESMILLKNNGILPLNSKRRIGIIGKNAKFPMIQGGGCANVNTTNFKTPYQAFCDYYGYEIPYADGYINDKVSIQSLKEALDIVKNVEIALLFVNAPEDAEGNDRKDLKFSKSIENLIKNICTANKKTVVILTNGSIIDIENWCDDANAILETFYSGQFFGDAVKKILVGDLCPSGRLTQTFPKRLEDTPSYLYSQQGEDDIFYGEDLFVGYKYYTSKNIDVRFPFGYGLSYTKFEFSDFKLSKNSISENEDLIISLKIKNIGNNSGKEVVQVYLKNNIYLNRPKLELKGF